jgi:hypothetical protein
MDNSYAKIKPNYKKGWHLFYPPLNREFPPFNDEKWGDGPDLPRDLDGENDYLGDKWDMLLLAQLHSGITGALAYQTKTTSKSYEWRKVTLNPTVGSPTIYGDTPEVQTMSEQYFKGYLEGTNAGISLPRGFQESGLQSYSLWWDMQKKMAIDTIERYIYIYIFFFLLNFIHFLNNKINNKIIIK